jgi:hypothetical protein
MLFAKSANLLFYGQHKPVLTVSDTLTDSLRTRFFADYVKNLVRRL